MDRKNQQLKLGAPFKPFFWLEWDTTALDEPACNQKPLLIVQ
jgi:hypothetical protein